MRTDECEIGMKVICECNNEEREGKIVRIRDYGAIEVKITQGEHYEYNWYTPEQLNPIK